MKVMVMKNITSNNNIEATKNRNLCKEKNIKLINIMASPGAGKTSTIMKVLETLKGTTNFAVIEGDIASSIDAIKLEEAGFKSIQINTGGGCHLNANSINNAINELDIENGTVFIENVGNLICPSSFDLGEELKVLIASVPEGHDKPFKYVSMFEYVDLIILNKWDLAPYIDFDYSEFERGVRAINKNAKIIKVSCKTGEGISELVKLFK